VYLPIFVIFILTSFFTDRLREQINMVVTNLIRRAGMTDDIPQYEIDSDTEALLATVLEMALLSSNMQLHEKDQHAIADIVFQTAWRFGIEIQMREVDPEHDIAMRTTPQELRVGDFPFDITILDSSSSTELE